MDDSEVILFHVGQLLTNPADKRIDPLGVSIARGVHNA